MKCVPSNAKNKNCLLIILNIHIVFVVLITKKPRLNIYVSLKIEQPNLLPNESNTITIHKGKEMTLFTKKNRIEHGEIIS